MKWRAALAALVLVFLLGIVNDAKAEARTDQQNIETGDLFLKGIAGIILVLLGQALIERWGGPSDPKHKHRDYDKDKPPS
jgi:hypothetical protein